MEKKTIKPFDGQPRYKLAVGDRCVCFLSDAELTGCAGFGRKLRTGRVVYIHPEGRYITVEFTGQPGAFGASAPGVYRRAVWPERCRPDGKEAEKILRRETA